MIDNICPCIPLSEYIPQVQSINCIGSFSILHSFPVQPFSSITDFEITVCKANIASTVESSFLTEPDIGYKII